ncbi:zinc finger BED domain-containing 1-like protein [Labeo rohita]|uniref:Zinc finger BED domain-containing 1-like protein n=1 Tax=Labeo rohita TaxID=84645 RepID=A0A498MBC4_LABRO|nr:zinc finger BED domain-containing 1-like protein [Labeo rohita]
MAAPAPATSPEATELVAKKRTTGSIIWRYFGFKASDEQQTDVYCRECRKLVPTKASSTTNLFHHLQTRHKLAYEECTRLRIQATKPTSSGNTPNTTQITLHNSITRSVEYERKSARWCSITESVAFHIAVDMAPISVVEQRGFIRHGMQDPRITRAISLCKKSVSAFSYSCKKRRELAEVQAPMNLPAHQLSTESTTRWGSRLEMVERVLEQERALAKVLSADKKTRSLVLTWQDIEVLEAIQRALRPLQDFTDALSGQEYVTLSYDCESEEAESGIAQTTVGINVIRGKGANPGDVGVVLQGLAVLQNLQSITHGCAMLLGLIYALNLNYPKDLKCTFEAFQKILTELDSAKLSPIDF